MKALKTALRSPQKGIRLYESINMEIFQSELSSKIKLEYINRIFKGCTLEEIENWIGILNIFYEEEGSIASTADRLYIHKNTLQYKLNKIKERTGYDPRSIRYSSLFYNAIHFYQDVRDKMII
jgi:carbohydrate diacid regulator